MMEKAKSNPARFKPVEEGKAIGSAKDPSLSSSLTVLEGTAQEESVETMEIRERLDRLMTVAESFLKLTRVRGEDLREEATHALRNEIASAKAALSSSPASVSGPTDVAALAGGIPEVKD